MCFIAIECGLLCPFSKMCGFPSKNLNMKLTNDPISACACLLKGLTDYVCFLEFNSDTLTGE